MSRPHPDDALARCHPVVCLAFFGLAIGTAMVFLHPVLTPITLAAAVGYALYLHGGRGARFQLLGMAPMFLAAALFNPLFSHAGVTTLFFLFDGNPVTLEPIVFGLAAAAMLVTVITWFSCSNTVLTSDKVGYLFGRILPALALLFSMALRFIPRLKAQLSVISYGQSGLGQGVKDGSLFQRLRAGARMFSILATWALENSIDIADSMKARGYGLPGRTAYSIFTFDRRDRTVLTVVAATAVLLVIGSGQGATTMTFYPALILAPVSGLSVVVWVAYAVLLGIPLILNLAEEWQWRRIALTI